MHANCSPFTIGYPIAANICINLNLGGYSDWFLPSKDELNEMYRNIGPGNVLGLGNIGEFPEMESDTYWSSSQINASNSWYQHFPVYHQSSAPRSSKMRVRAIRAF